MNEINKPRTEEERQNLLQEWYKINDALGAMKSKESLLRAAVYREFFVKKDENGQDILPEEGTNKFSLPHDYVLKAQRVINRTVDAAALKQLSHTKAELEYKIANGITLSDEEALQHKVLKGILLEELIKYKPELAIKEYRTLTVDEQRVFDDVLVIRDGSPQLEIVLPKRK
ncbi:MAG TPA: hypothetical protein VN039_13345 [Nitrospira sp.]|nr:hypothetical protein [Nitrospira sp.]